MNNTQAIQIMIALSDGINPMTGEVYDSKSPYYNKDISKALLYAADQLSNNVMFARLDRPIQLCLDDEVLFEQLRSWRIRCAKRDQIQLQQILSNDSLKMIAYYKPQTVEQLLQIHGIGEKKARKYGADLFDIIRSHKMHQ